ncbi:MAG TPA: hypothetical protein VGB64_05520 [Actinomycetota bacterium]
MAVAWMLAACLGGRVAADTELSGFYVTTTLQHDWTYEIACAEASTSSRSNYFLVATLLGPSGDMQAHLFSASTGVSELGVSAGVNEVFVEGVLQSQGRSEGRKSINGVVAEDGSTLRVGWASWGGTQECDIRVNGTRLFGRPLAHNAAGALRTSEGSGGVGVAAMYAPGVGVALDREQRIAYRSGYLAAMSVLDYGNLSARGEGETIESQGHSPHILIARQLHGDWHFGATGFSNGQFPWLWYLLFPA